jgi:hypothetical protein
MRSANATSCRLGSEKRRFAAVSRLTAVLATLVVTITGLVGLTAGPAAALPPGYHSDWFSVGGAFS